MEKKIKIFLNTMIWDFLKKTVNRNSIKTVFTVWRNMAKFLWEFGKILTLSIRQPCGRRRQALRSSVRSSVCPSLRGGSGKISRELKETENNAKILLLRGVGWEQSETKSEWEARAGSTAPPFVSHP